MNESHRSTEIAREIGRIISPTANSKTLLTMPSGGSACDRTRCVELYLKFPYREAATTATHSTVNSASHSHRETSSRIGGRRSC
jgi:hypothetical protein